MSSGLPLLAQLTKGARAAYPYISALVSSELTPTQIVQQAKAAGFAFRNQAGFDIVAALRNAQSGPQYLRSLDPSAIPNPDKFPKSPNRILRNYSYRVTVHGVNPDTGETHNIEVTVSTNDVLSVNQVKDKAGDVMLANPNAYEMDITSMDVTNVFKSASLG